jgi:hypothetical protein
VEDVLTLRVSNGDPQVADSVQCEAALSVLESLGGARTFDFALLSGSVAAGLGHANSDIDVHVVLADGGHLDRHSFTAGDGIVQLTELDIDQLERTVALTEAYVATRENREQAALESKDLWHVIRLYSGRPILGPAATLESLVERMNRDVARQVVAANFAPYVARAAENAEGMIADGRYRAAAHAAALALRNACEVALAAAGDLYAIDRFLLARIERSKPFEPLRDEIWSLLYEFPAASTGDELVSATRERLFAAAAITAHSLLEGWHQPLRDLPVLEASRGGPGRAWEFALLRFSDAFALAGPRRSLRIGEGVAAVWASLDGSPVETVAGRLTARGWELTVDDVQGAVESLMRAGAVRPPVPDALGQERR